MSMFRVYVTREHYDEAIEHLKKIDKSYYQKDWAKILTDDGELLYVFNDIREQKDNACWYYLRQLEKAGLLTLIWGEP